MEYFPIRAHGNEEFWHKVQLLARLRKTSLGALVTETVATALGNELRLLDEIAAPGVSDKQRELQGEADHA